MKKQPMTVQDFARLGGKTTLKKHGKDHFKNISKKGVEARRLKKEAQAQQPEENKE